MSVCRRIPSTLFIVFAALVPQLFSVRLALAAPAVTDATWTNTAGGSWNDAANWSSSPDYPNGIGATARFTSIQTANRAFTLDADVTVGSIVIDNATNKTNSIGVLNVTTPTLTLDAAAGAGPATITVTGNSSGSATPNNIFSSVILNDDLVVTVDRTASTSAAGALTFRGAGLSGVGGVTKAGPGTLTFADSVKTFTGPLVVNLGRLRINVPAGRPTKTASVTINGAGQLDLAGIGSYTFGANADTKIFLNGPGPANDFPNTFGGTIRVDGKGVNEITNEIVLQSNSSIHIQDAANTTTLSNTISGPGSLTLPAAGTDGNIGTLNLNGVNTYTGGTIINDGTVNASGPSGLGTATGPLAVNNQNNGQPGKDVVLNLSSSDPTTTGSLSGTIATPTSGVNTVTINTSGPSFTVNQSTAGTYAGIIAGSGDFALGNLSTNTLTLTGTHAYTGATTVNAGTLKVTGSIASSSGVTVNAGTFEAATSQTVRTLAVAPNGIANITTTGARTVLTVGDNANPTPLSVSGKLDLITNALAVNVPDGSESAALSAVRGFIIAGFNPSAPGKIDGKWDGKTGITSRTIAAGATGKAIGYGLASEVPTAAAGQFLDQPVDDSTVLARYTLAGDATLDGTVDFNDLVKLAQNYNTTVSATTQSWWTHGDFNYDGITDFNDLVKLAQNYNTILPANAVPGASALFQADLARAFASVPEPTFSCIAISLLATLLMRRRRSAKL